MRALITGASGLVGYQIATGLERVGWQIIRLGRAPGDDIGYALGDAPDLPAAEMLIHCAFDHLPGRYRGGEGDDPEGFRTRNLGGSMALFQAAKRAGIGRCMFLSSRAVYGPQAAADQLIEDMRPDPDTLYGVVKFATEVELARMASADFIPISIRATGIYGPPPPGRAHKWAGLFADFQAGKPILPRVGTELHGGDLADAVVRLSAAPPGVYNASDIILDRHDLLAEVAALVGCAHPLPARADPAGLKVMATSRLAALGWQPGGMEVLRATLPRMLEASGGDI